MRRSVGNVRRIIALGVMMTVALLAGALAASGAQARQVLLYNGNLAAFSFDQYTSFAGATGATVVPTVQWPQSLNGNACVILNVNQLAFNSQQKQAMVSYMNQGGTVVAIGEFGGYQGDFPRTVMNDVAAGVGSSMRLNNVLLDSNFQTSTNIDADPLTQDVASIRYAGVSSLLAGTGRPLLRTTSASLQAPNTPFAGAQQIGNGTFVLLGDGNVLADQSNTGYTVEDNDAFANNLCGDRTPPEVQIAVPIAGKRYKRNAVVPAAYSCTDPEGTGDIPPGQPVGDVPVGDPIDTVVPAGTTATKSFTVDCTDEAGLSDSETVQYVVDDVKPVITIDAPSNITYSQGQTVIADYGCEDDGPLPSGQPVGTVGDNVAINTTTIGPQAFTVTCTDAAGNVSEQTVTYTVVDNIPPTITIARPGNNARYSLNQSVTASYSCIDEDGIQDIAFGQPVGTVGHLQQFDTAGTPGDTVTKTFTVTCSDKAGNTAQQQVTYYVDDKDPVITIVAPVPISAGAYRLNQVPAPNADYACVDDGPGVSVTGVGPGGPVPNGQPFPVGQAGDFPFNVTCTDQVGNAATPKSVTYRVDGTPPTISVSAPFDGRRYKQGAAGVPSAYSCSDNDAVPSGQPVGTGTRPDGSVGTIPVGQPFYTTTEGPRTFNVTCVDRAGNAAVPKNVAYFVDGTPPVITVTSPGQNGRYGLGQNIASDYGCVDPPSFGETEDVDLPSGQPVGPVPDGQPFDTATAGAKLFGVTCEDQAGNQATPASVPYVVDGTGPAITITAPANGGRYRIGQQVPADYGCTDPEDGLQDGSPSGPVAVGENFDTASVGEKSFTVVCFDTLGNRSEKTHTYRVVGDNPPAVDIQSPKDGASFGLNATIPLSFSCSDPDGQDDIVRCARVGATGPLDSSKPGTFEVTVEAVDQTGKRATKTHKYTVTSKPAAAVAPTTASGGTTKKACASRRQFTIRVKKTKKKEKVRIVRATVFVNGKKTQVKKGRRVTAVVTLKGLPKGRYTVRIVAKLSDGRTITDVRRFRTCTPKGRTS